MADRHQRILKQHVAPLLNVFANKQDSSMEKHKKNSTCVNTKQGSLLKGAPAFFSHHKKH